MSNRAPRFKQSDLTRAINGAKKAGLRVSGATIDPNGKITILTDLAAISSANQDSDWDVT